MSCYYHNDRAAVASCSECGALICEACAVDIDEAVVCKKCVERMVYSGRGPARKHASGRDYRRAYHDPRPHAYAVRDRGPSLFLTLMFSCLPGAAHMYLGLLRRGSMIMIAFFASICLTAAAGGFMAFTIPILFFLSLFDAINIRKNIIFGRSVHDDIDDALDFFRKYKAIFIALLVLMIFSVMGNMFYIPFVGYNARNLFGFAVMIGGIFFVLKAMRRRGPDPRRDAMPSERPKSMDSEDDEIDMRNNK